MPADNNPVQPTPFEAAPSSKPAEPGVSPEHAGGGPPSWVVPALGGLLLLGALVVFWLPGQVDTQAPGPMAEPVVGGDTPTAAPQDKPQSAAGREEASPWSDAQLARLRKEAQDVLGELLDVQFRLEERAVDQWAGEAFAEAVGIAQAGDALYKNREFEPATAAYRDALERLLALEAALPAALQQQLDAANEAIESSQPEQLATALALGELLEPGHPELASLAQRGEQLPELMALMASAAEAEQAGNLVAARESLQAAVNLDGAHQRAAAELARVSAAYQQQQFNDAMSDGYSALDDGRYESARSAFRRAAQLEPGSSEAASALQEVATAETGSRLQRLQQQGERQEGDENWADAVKAYQDALAIDANILFAREGLARSEPRARLDKQFRTALDDPDRLADVAVAEATENMLQQARRITPAGPVLRKQIEDLATLLEKANKPLTVALRSDGETEVIVYKVARLGRFEQQELTLRPGTYTALGTRNGYRDVRRTFRVGHDADSGPVTIACTEPI